jgi:hypothetical protein
MHILFIAHSEIFKFEQPESTGAYDRYQLKCNKKVTPLIKEWVDLLLFVNYKTFVIEEQGKTRAIGGHERMLYTQHSPAYDAKNRFNMEPEIPFNFDAIAPIFAQNVQVTRESLIEDLQNKMMSSDITPTQLCSFLVINKKVSKEIPVEQYPEDLLIKLNDERNWNYTVYTINKGNKND